MTTPSTQEFLNAAALRTTSTKPEFVGYWLAKNCLTDKLTPEQLATKLATDAMLDFAYALAVPDAK